MEYLRRRKTPLTPEHEALFLETCEAMNVGIRAAKTISESAPADEPTDCGCWPRYLTCRCAVRAENGA